MASSDLPGFYGEWILCDDYAPSEEWADEDGGVLVKGPSYEKGVVYDLWRTVQPDDEWRPINDPRPQSGSWSFDNPVYAKLFALAMDYGAGEKLEELDKLKEKLSALTACNDKVTAAAFGYLMAKHEEEEEEPAPPTVFDHCLAVIKQCKDGQIDDHEAVEIVLGLAYCHADNTLKEAKFLTTGTTRSFIREAFAPFIKPALVRPIDDGEEE